MNEPCVVLSGLQVGARAVLSGGSVRDGAIGRSQYQWERVQSRRRATDGGAAVRRGARDRKSVV